MKNKRKSGFLLFWFSLLPGAGEMYLGFMRQGISLMCLFWGIIAFSTWLTLGPLLFLLPVLWFYSFFHAHNLYKMPDDQFYRTPDTFFFGLDGTNPLSDLFKRFHNSIAIVFILLGISILWSCFLDVLYWILPSFFYDFFHRLTSLVPRVAMGFLVIFMGLHFIRGKKRDLNEHDTWNKEPERQNWGTSQPQEPVYPPKPANTPDYTTVQTNRQTNTQANRQTTTQKSTMQMNPQNTQKEQEAAYQNRQPYMQPQADQLYGEEPSFPSEIELIWDQNQNSDLDR